MGEFSRHRGHKDGLQPQCKACKAAYHAADWAADPDKHRARTRVAYAAWAKANPEKCNARARAYKKANPGKCCAAVAKRNAAKLQATPAWADQDKIESVYAQAAEIGAHVDHAVPLKSKLVCGLHNEFNLQLLTPAENLKKGNRFAIND